MKAGDVAISGIRWLFPLPCLQSGWKQGGRKRLNLCRILSEVPKVAKTREGKKAEGGGKRQLIPLITSDLQIDLKCYAKSIFESYKAFFKWFLFAILRSILHLVSSVTFRNIVNALIFCGSIMLCQLKVYGWSRKLTERAVWRLFILAERDQRI